MKDGQCCVYSCSVEAFGIKELLPAYLDPTLQPEDLLTGVVIAAGGAGYDPLTAQLAVLTLVPFLLFPHTF